MMIKKMNDYCNVCAYILYIAARIVTSSQVCLPYQSGGGGWIQTCALALYVWEDVWMYGCMDGG